MARGEHRWEVVDMTLCCDLCPPSKNGGCKSFFLGFNYIKIYLLYDVSIILTLLRIEDKYNGPNSITQDFIPKL